MLVDAERLERGLAAAFATAGATAGEAALIARHLVEASLRGHDSHGVGLLPHYLEAIRDGMLRLGLELQVASDLGYLLVCDGGQGPGQVMAHEATRMGIERARKHGVCVVALRDSYHVGRIGHWAEQYAAAGLVSIHFVNVPGHAAVTAFGGTAARLGTNPFAAGFPRSGGEPLIVDFATSRWAVGKVRVAMQKGETLPEGILLDADGLPGIDPSLLFATPSGALLPFGEHKGFGLALACELLAGALTGGSTQTGAKAQGVTNSMLSIALSPEHFGGGAAYGGRLDALAAWLASDDPRGSPIKLPGDPERALRQKRLVEGIPVEPATWEAMIASVAALGHVGPLA
jgi:uncharacterized oxidoreductase